MFQRKSRTLMTMWSEMARQWYIWQRLVPSCTWCQPFSGINKVHLFVTHEPKVQMANIWRKCLNVHMVCKHFGLNVHTVCTNFGLNVHTPVYKRAPNDLKTLPMGISHDYMSCWTTLGPFRYPRGPQNGPKQHQNGLERLKITRMAQNGTEWPKWP